MAAVAGTLTLGRCLARPSRNCLTVKPLVARSLLVVPVAVVALAGVALALRDGGGGAPLRTPSRPFVASVLGERAVLWAVGDGADGGGAGRAVGARIARGRVDRLLYLGDVYGAGGVASDGTAGDYRDRYDPLYGRLAERTAPTPGNHEWPRRAGGYYPYWTKVHGRAPAYYAFSAGGWRISPSATWASAAGRRTRPPHTEIAATPPGR